MHPVSKLLQALSCMRLPWSHLAHCFGFRILFCLFLSLKDLHLVAEV